MFNYSPSPVNTSNTAFNMSPVKNPAHTTARFSIERDHTTNTYTALMGKTAASRTPDKLVLSDINGIANQIPELKRFDAPLPEPKMLNDDLNTKFFITSITVMGIYLFYKLSTLPN